MTALEKTESPGAVHLFANRPSRLKYTIGVVALVFVVIGWEILKHYKKPFLMSVLGCFSLQSYFIFLLLGDPIKQKAVPSPDSKPPLTVKETAKLGLLLFSFYFCMNYFSTISFGLTSPGSASIIASTCGFFTLVIGFLARVETISWLKIVAVLISTGGVLVLGISEFMSETNKTLGNIFALLGAALYGLHSTLLNKATGDESRVSTLILFAFTGLYVTICAGPVFYILHLTGVETFQLPPTGKIWLYIAINILFGSLIPNYLWNVAFLYTSQLVVAIGISFATPLTLLIEYICDPLSVSWQQMASAACISVAFALVNLAELRPDLDEKIE